MFDGCFHSPCIPVHLLHLCSPFSLLRLWLHRIVRHGFVFGHGLVWYGGLAFVLSLAHLFDLRLVMIEAIMSL